MDEEPFRENIKITKTLVKKLIVVINKGLSNGMGDPAPGHMCVEAAVCYVLGYAHNDDPECVYDSLRRAKIQLNDAAVWADEVDRAMGLRRLAIMQLNTISLDWPKFNAPIKKWVIQHLPSMIFTLLHKSRIDAEKMSKAAARCEKTPSVTNFKKFNDCMPSDYYDEMQGVLAKFEYPNSSHFYGPLMELLSSLPGSATYEVRKFVYELCEVMVQQLIKMGMPGSEFVELAPYKAPKNTKSN